MILTCPECATRYQTDAAQFSPEGRKVRCAKCSHVWFQAPPTPEPEMGVTEPAAGPEAEAVAAEAPRREAYAAPRRIDPVYSGSIGRPQRFERLGLVAGWLGLAVIVFAIGWSAVRYRQSIANLWPQSSTLYAAIGKPVNTSGLEFRDRNAHFETENGQDVLVITGNLVNVTSREMSVPPIRVSLSDADKRELYHWNFSAGVGTLHPGQLATFRTQLPSPPPAARHIELRLAPERIN